MPFESSAFQADPELIAAIEKQAAPVHCTESRHLFSQGDLPAGLYLLQAGRVSLSMRSGTGEVILSVSALPGALLGLPAVVGNEPYSLTAIATAGSDLCFLNREDFGQLMLTTPDLSLRVLRVLAAEVRNARGAISEF